MFHFTLKWNRISAFSKVHDCVVTVKVDIQSMRGQHVSPSHDFCGVNASDRRGLKRNRVTFLVQGDR